MAITKQRHFEIMREVLATVEERGSITLADAAQMVGVGPAELRALLDPVLYLEFRRDDGEIVDRSRAFLLTEGDVLVLDQGHWLRNLTARPPERETALALFVAGATMQALATEPTPDLDAALDVLADLVAVTLRLPVDQPAALDAAQRAWNEGRSLRVRYLRDGADEPRDREILPWRVFAKWGRWYVHGIATDGDEPHYYRVDRMLDARLGDLRFDPPDHDEIPEWFDLSAHARTVRVRIRADALESLPAPHQLGDATPCDGDGRVVELDVTVHGDRRVEHLLVCLPADAEVLTPPDAAERRRAHADRLLAAYRSG
ncbi:MAG: helix-turn-helix transcriptional regulator [Actinomycetota bacterium]